MRAREGAIPLLMAEVMKIALDTRARERVKEGGREGALAKENVGQSAIGKG